MDSDFLRLARRVKAVEEAQTGVTGAAAGARMAGEMLLWPGAATPEGWLLCDGAAVSRADYAALFAVIGTAYGSGDGSTTFNLPNLKGRVAAGRDSADTAFDGLGETGGAKTHKLTATEMPSHTHVQNSHTHSFSLAASGGRHMHKLYWPSTPRYISLSASNGGGTARSNGYSTGYSSDTVYDQSLIAASETADGWNSDHWHTVGGAISAATPTGQNTGGGGGHNNLPPYIVLNYIIKA